MQKQWVIMGWVIITLMGCEAKAESIYPTMQEIYDDCTQAVNLAQTDMKGFLRTGCAGRINSIVRGPLLEIAMGIHPPSVGQKLTEQQEIELKTVKKILTMTCFPWNDATKEKPIEYLIAQKLVQRKELQEGAWASANDPFLFWPLIRTMYPCNLTKENKHGLDN